MEKWKDGSKYTGKYKEGKKHGNGKYEKANGDVFEGFFKNDVFQGNGIY